jgi:uncharacterized protein
MSYSPFDGVRFTCQPGCTACCERKGFVYLTEEDVAKAAAYVGMTAEDFERKYIYRTKHQRRLRKPRGKECAFLGEGGCTIHPAKPTQCRLFPFWPYLLGSRLEWAATAKWCPGIGKGELVQIGTAMEIASEMDTAYPGFF